MRPSEMDPAPRMLVVDDDSSLRRGERVADVSGARMARILVVDDDPCVNAAIAQLLRKVGYEVLQASDGEQAMEMLGEHSVDLTIVDIFMGNVDGMELTMRIREQTPEAKIIAMSGGGVMDKSNVLEIARRFGAARTLAKPFESEDLMVAVVDLLEDSE